MGNSWDNAGRVCADRRDVRHAWSRMAGRSGLLDSGWAARAVRRSGFGRYQEGYRDEPCAGVHGPGIMPAEVESVGGRRRES